jgi:CRISPR-associated protein Cas2
MIIVSYDISEDKLRTRFAKFLQKYGNRMQYSVFKIENSKRMLDIVKKEIDNKFEKLFKETDSVLIVETSENCKISRYGFLKHEESDIILVK